MKRYFPFSIDAEYDSLLGLSDLAVRVYLVLRRCMCHITGTVGQRRPISYTMLAEHCETAIPKGAGHQRSQPTRKELRVAIASLERADLLTRLAADAPVFRLKKALTAADVQARPNQTGPEQGQGSSVATHCFNEEKRHTGPLHSPEPGTHINSKYDVSTESAAARKPSPVDNSAGRIAADFLSKLSKRLGYPILHRHDDPRLAAWVESGLTFEALENAVLAAKAARDRDNSRAPLNPGYIASFLPSEHDWLETWTGITTKGRSLGLHQAPGESGPAYKARVIAAAATPKTLTA